MADKHSTWQTEPNAVVSEIGDWRPMDRDTLLSKIKTIAGSNGVVTYRGMQQTAVTVRSQIKIWITANKWVKVHTDPLAQRRIHAVYMPKPLNIEMGGPYSSYDISELISQENVVNFYYWLGNECEYKITLDQYMVATSRQNSESYRTYLESTESKDDVVSTLIYSRTWENFEKMMHMVKMTIDDVEWKYNKDKDIVINHQDLKRVLKQYNMGAVVSKTIDRIASEKEDNKRVRFDSGLHKYITIFGPPGNLETVEEIPMEKI
jgi:hypothetical protein